MLSDRRQRVLSALIEEYVSYALPVGSRTLIERYPLGVSSATVRNELSRLEDDGYLLQPHTSAGRIPTDAGYRAFVDDLIERDLVPHDEAYAHVVEQLKETSSELDDLLQQMSFQLSRFTDCLSVVLAPALYDFRLKQISLVSLSSTQFLCVLVTEDGEVLNKHVNTLFDIDSDDLARVQVYLNQVMCGRSLHELESGLQEVMGAALRDPLVSTCVNEILACLREGSGVHAHSLGMSTLLSKPEFSHSQSIIPVMHMVEDDALLLEILDRCVTADESAVPAVSIGSENGAAELLGVSVVASKFGKGNHQGIVAVIGPTRMDYSRVVAAVRSARDALSDSC